MNISRWQIDSNLLLAFKMITGIEMANLILTKKNKELLLAIIFIVYN